MSLTDALPLLTDAVNKAAFIGQLTQLEVQVPAGGPPPGPWDSPTFVGVRLIVVPEGIGSTGPV
jgi:hypothetical protein